jgi:hypothetical protein
MELKTGLATQATSNILSGRITRVDAESGRVDVIVQSPYQRFFTDCEVASSFRGQGLGGFDFKPTVGAYCVVLENLSASNRGMSASAMVIAFRGITQEARNIVGELAPGDIRVQGENGNEVLFRKNGDVYLVSDQQCMLSLLSTEEIVRINSPSYEHSLGGGSFRWSVSADELGGPVAYLLGIKEFESDPAPYLTVSAGAAVAGGLNVTLNRPGAASGVPNTAFVSMVDAAAGFHFDVTSDGSVSIASTGSWTQESIGSMLISSTVSLGMSAPSVALSGGAGSIGVDATGQIRQIAPAGSTVDAPLLELSYEGQRMLFSDNTVESRRVVTEDILPWLFNHVHPTPMGVSLPPLQGPTLVQQEVMADVLIKLSAYIAAISLALPPTSAAGTALLNALSLYALPAVRPNMVDSEEDVRTTDTKVR